MAEVSYRSEDGVAVITFSRPQAKNSLNAAACEQLHEAWRRFAGDDGDRVAVLAAEGPHFCTGGDVRDMPDNVLVCMPNLAVRCDKPIIAAVSGWVIGAGASMAMMSDMVVAASDARFVYPEAKVGAFAGLMGGFPGRMPVKVGMQWTMTGDPMDAQRAYEVGLVNELCEPGQQLARARELARKIAANAPLVTRALKSLAYSTLPKGPVEQHFVHQLMLQDIRHSADYTEGLAALNEKRKPAFTGR